MTEALDCGAAREQLIADIRGWLTPDEKAALTTHLAGCAACARRQRAERGLTDLLERRLPQHPAPLALKRQLAARWLEDPPPVVAPRRRRALVAAAGIGLLGAAALALLLVGRPDRPASHALMAEAVNDHLRLIGGQQPLGVESGGLHQVKPWFAGRLDFAPVLTFLGDDEFPLAGGAVSQFLDRQAAVFAFRRRLHRISLFVVRADGLPWPPAGGPPRLTTERGFGLLSWRVGELGYVLVSDVGSADLLALQKRVAQP